MFDTMTMTKAVGAICGSLLVLMLATWAGSALYSVGAGGHGGEDIAQAYTIDTGAEESTAGDAADAPDFAEIYATADAGAGASAFRKCAACHKLDGSDGVGPHLNGIVDRAKAASAGYAYSEALVAMSADVWTPENLDAFLVSPRQYMPGTKMAFAGLPNPQERANVIAYLASNP